MGNTYIVLNVKINLESWAVFKKPPKKAPKCVEKINSSRQMIKNKRKNQLI